MSAFALAVVLFSAFLHAGWNAMLKAVDDRAGVLAAVSAAHALAGVALISVSPIPAMASWPALIVSARNSSARRASEAESQRPPGPSA